MCNFQTCAKQISADKPHTRGLGWSVSLLKKVFRRVPIVLAALHGLQIAAVNIKLWQGFHPRRDNDIHLTLSYSPDLAAAAFIPGLGAAFLIPLWFDKKLTIELPDGRYYQSV